MYGVIGIHLDDIHKCFDMEAYQFREYIDTILPLYPNPLPQKTIDIIASKINGTSYYQYIPDNIRDDILKMRGYIRKTIRNRLKLVQERFDQFITPTVLSEIKSGITSHLSQYVGSVTLLPDIHHNSTVDGCLFDIEKMNTIYPLDKFQENKFLHTISQHLIPILQTNEIQDGALLYIPSKEYDSYNGTD